MGMHTKNKDGFLMLCCNAHDHVYGQTAVDGGIRTDDVNKRLFNAALQNEGWLWWVRWALESFGVDDSVPTWPRAQLDNFPAHATERDIGWPKASASWPDKLDGEWAIMVRPGIGLSRGPTDGALYSGDRWTKVREPMTRYKIVGAHALCWHVRQLVREVLASRDNGEMTENVFSVISAILIKQNRAFIDPWRMGVDECMDLLCLLKHEGIRIFYGEDAWRWDQWLKDKVMK